MMLISFVIVEYQSLEAVQRCIGLLREHLSMPFEIIVSSNSGYADELRESINKDSIGARWLFNEHNGGFAYAMNRGLEAAEGDVLVIMNSDCMVREDLSSMVEYLLDHPETGAIAPQMRDADGTVQDTARPYVSVPRLIKRMLLRFLSGKESVLEREMDYCAVQPVDWLIGSFIMVSRNIYGSVGCLDERFFMYAEDIDWCTRIRKAGYKVVYFPNVAIEYKGTRRARHSWKYFMIFIRSHLLLWKKHGFLSCN